MILTKLAAISVLVRSFLRAARSAATPIRPVGQAMGFASPGGDHFSGSAIGFEFLLENRSLSRF
jgi:hypothetical protein